MIRRGDDHVTTHLEPHQQVLMHPQVRHRARGTRSLENRVPSDAIHQMEPQVRL